MLNPDLVLTCANFLADLLTVVLGFAVILLAREHLPYFPAVVVLVTTKVVKAAYHAWVNWPLRSAADRDWLQQPGYELLVQLLILGGLMWTLLLIGKQNSVDMLGHVDIDGRIHWYTPSFMRRRAIKAMADAQAIDPWETEPTPIKAGNTVKGGLQAIAAHRRQREQRGLG